MGSDYKKIKIEKITDMQEKYGVVIAQPAYGIPFKPPEVQPAYGVPYRPPEVQPAYGVPISPEIQPAYGVPITPGTDISITYDQLDEMISTLKSATSGLKDSWNNGTKTNVAKLQNSWVGKDCEAYTSKLTNMDKQVQNTISALELLSSTYEKARDMVQENQRSVMSGIQSLDIKS